MPNPYDDLIKKLRIITPVYNDLQTHYLQEKTTIREKLHKFLLKEIQPTAKHYKPYKKVRYLPKKKPVIPANGVIYTETYSYDRPNLLSSEIKYENCSPFVSKDDCSKKENLRNYRTKSRGRLGRRATRADISSCDMNKDLYVDLQKKYKKAGDGTITEKILNWLFCETLDRNIKKHYFRHLINATYPMRSVANNKIVSYYCDTYYPSSLLSAPKKELSLYKDNDYFQKKVSRSLLP